MIRPTLISVALVRPALLAAWVTPEHAAWLAAGVIFGLVALLGLLPWWLGRRR